MISFFSYSVAFSLTANYSIETNSLRVSAKLFVQIDLTWQCEKGKHKHTKTLINVEFINA